MTKYRLITPFEKPCVAVYDTELSTKKSLTHAVNSLATAKDINKAWQYFEKAGWRVEKLQLQILKTEK